MGEKQKGSFRHFPTVEELTLPVFSFLPADGHNAVIVNSLLEKQSGESGVKTNIRSMNPLKSTAEEGSV